MLLLVLSGLGVGTVVVLLFVEDLAGLHLKPFVAGAFSAAIALLMSALGLFLRETHLATEALRIPENCLELGAKALAA